MRWLLLISAVALCSFAQAKTISLLVEGDSASIPKFINVCREMGPERGLDFVFIDSSKASFDYRVVLSTEGSSAWDFAHGNIVVLNPESKVVFTVTRAIAGRLKVPRRL
jgi:hypothetical protein